MIPHHTCHARASASPFYAPVTTVPTLPPRHCYRLLPHSATTTATTTIAKTKSRQLVIVAATDFHQKRLAANPSPLSSPSSSLLSLSPPSLVIRLAERDDELEASAWLRARSFYAYPPERKFAGEIHQMMVAEEEFKSLKAARIQRMLNDTTAPENSACIVALCNESDLIPSPPSPEQQVEVDERLRVTDDGEHWRLVVGTLDLHAVRAMPDEVLIGNCENAAYLANVCTAPIARRRGVGEALLGRARGLAREWGVHGMYVHTLAVNEIAMRFYDRNGFVVEKEETPNQAHHRGRCLDGIEGRGRSVLLRDAKLFGRVNEC